ncbi:unnamed protein product, partial [Tilletia caries]
MVVTPGIVAVGKRLLRPGTSEVETTPGVGTAPVPLGEPEVETAPVGVVANGSKLVTPGTPVVETSVAPGAADVEPAPPGREIDGKPEEAAGRSEVGTTPVAIAEVEVEGEPAPV